MRRRGFERAREFSWERSVARTLDVYRRVGAPLAVAAV
jgi:glycosyltransferase involved in cell wall biosynthesis